MIGQIYEAIESRQSRLKDDERKATAFYNSIGAAEAIVKAACAAASSSGKKKALASNVVADDNQYLVRKPARRA